MAHTPIRAWSITVVGALGVALAACNPGGPTTAPTSVPVGRPAVLSVSSPGPEPVRAVDLAEGTQDHPVHVEVDGGAGGVGVTIREITIRPGGSTGEHCHYGQLIGVITSGDLTHYADIYPGGVRVYTAGESIIEGAGYRHEGRNEGTDDVVLAVTYVIPQGKPLAETDLANCEP